MRSKPGATRSMSTGLLPLQCVVARRARKSGLPDLRTLDCRSRVNPRSVRRSNLSPRGGDCFVEFTLGLAEGETRGLAMTMSSSSVPGGRAAGGIGDAAVAPPERRDPLHLVVVEAEIEHGEILGDSLRVR